MPTVIAETFEEWRSQARGLLRDEIRPAEVRFGDDPEQMTLFDGVSGSERAAVPGQPSATVRVPSQFMDLARTVWCHRDPIRMELLYRVLWRLAHGEPQLLEVTTDDDVHRLLAMEKAVRRDAHKMKAFVRFRRILDGAQERFVAWHRPDHRIVRLVAPFFSRRFPQMHWTILTPVESVTWDGQSLTFGAGVPAREAPSGDELEDLWKTYYASTFNPARIKLRMMTQEMPARHWKTLPETDIIPDLLADAPRRVSEMIARSEGLAHSASDFFAGATDWPGLRTAASHCEGCDLHRMAIQTVFGEGPVPAGLMLVGEQPGDSEDRIGRPFVGPAGEVLDRALLDAGIDREDIYLTNTVKHFKHVPRGPRRLHKKPDSREMAACRPWLEAELSLVQPEVLVCLGATAAQSLIGRHFRITSQRGEFVGTDACRQTVATYHPSAVLRAPDPERKELVYGLLVADLTQAKRRLRHVSG